MNREIVAVYDTEADFASRFVGYLKSMHEQHYDLYAFTEFDALKRFVEKHRTDMLIISQKSMENLDESVDELNVKRIVVLSENKSESYLDYKAVEKYRAADIVFREAVQFAIEKKTGADVISNEVIFDNKIIGIYSPVNRCMKTTFSLTLSNIMGDKEKVLYINFEEYSGFKFLTDRDYISDLSDLMYYFLQDTGNMKDKIYKVCRQYGKFDFIPPMMFTTDIRNIDMDIWESFVLAIQELKIYDFIVLDITDMFQNVTDMLRMCDEIYMPVLSDNVSEAKVKEFEASLIDKHENEILDKIKKFVIEPEKYIDRYSDNFEKIINGSFKDFVKEIVGGIIT